MSEPSRSNSNYFYGVGASHDQVDNYSPYYTAPSSIELPHDLEPSQQKAKSPNSAAVSHYTSLSDRDVSWRQSGIFNLVTDGRTLATRSPATDATTMPQTPAELTPHLSYPSEHQQPIVSYDNPYNAYSVPYSAATPSTSANVPSAVFPNHSGYYSLEEQQQAPPPPTYSHSPKKIPQQDSRRDQIMQYHDEPEGRSSNRLRRHGPAQTWTSTRRWPSRLPSYKDSNRKRSRDSQGSGSGSDNAKRRRIGSFSPAEHTRWPSTYIGPLPQPAQLAPNSTSVAFPSHLFPQYNNFDSLPTRMTIAPTRKARSEQMVASENFIVYYRDHMHWSWDDITTLHNRIWTDKEEKTATLQMRKTRFWLKMKEALSKAAHGTSNGYGGMGGAVPGHAIIGHGQSLRAQFPYLPAQLPVNIPPPHRNKMWSLDQNFVADCASRLKDTLHLPTDDWKKMEGDLGPMRLDVNRARMNPGHWPM